MSKTNLVAKRPQYNRYNQQIPVVVRRNQPTMSLTSRIALVAGTLALSASPALADSWKIDGAHSSANFAVKHMMVSNVRGRFQKVSGKAEYDGKSVKSIKVDAVIDTATVDTDNEKRDEHLKGKDFFNVEKFPEMKFVSKKVVPAGKGKFKMTGDLTLHGVTKQVTLDVDGPSQIVKDPKGNSHVGASASTTINRKDYGITYNGVLDNGGAMVSDDVKITLDIEMVKDGAAAEKKSEAKPSSESKKKKAS